MTPLYHPRPDRWPQVSLKGLFVLVTLLGVVCWLGVQVKWIHDRHEALERYYARNSVSIRRTWRGAVSDLGPKEIVACEPALPARRAPWSIAILGETGVGGLPQDDPELARLFPENLRPD